VGDSDGYGRRVTEVTLAERASSFYAEGIERLRRSVS
jgi:hypothetical protein